MMASQSESFDFAALPILDEGILLEGLRQRYNEDYIYVSPPQCCLALATS